jgi:Flp pilus assembly protein TadG
MKMKILRGESGQVLIISALCMACLMGFVACAVDVGLLLRAKRVLQIAADSAAIAGAAEIIPGDVTTAAQADAAQNGVTNGVNGVTVAVHNGPSTGPHAGNLAYVEVIVSQPQPSFFLKVFNWNSVPVTARAVATNVPSPSCIYTLFTTGKDVDLTGSGSLTVSNCGILDNSSSGNALNLTGSGNISAQSIGIVGNFNKTGSGTLSPNPPTTGMSAVSDPLSSLSPPTFSAGSCVADPSISGSTAQTIGPAVSGGTICYNGLTISGSSAVTFNPGLYIINGNFKSSGSGNLTGTGGVTFYMPPGSNSFSVTGSGNLNFTAPTSGPYSGILFYQNPLDAQGMSFSGSSASTLNGIFYLPTAPLSMTGSGGAGFNTDLVVGSLSITGSLPLHEYIPLSGTSPLSNPRLVE